MSDKRLIEAAFPLAEASAASLHEKSMRHGHISTLHLWPARRPLAASRAAIAAALLPDPGDDNARKQLIRRLGGRLKLKKQTKAEAGRKLESAKVEGDGGILWWGQESSAEVEWFREKIREANGGRAPKVLDPFAGGGAIPLEAMRLGCEVVANDLNPVAWFLLKCTLEYPQRLSGETRPLPVLAMRDEKFAKAFLKAQGLKGIGLDQGVSTMVAIGRGEEATRGFLEDLPWERAGLGWHVRAWGMWVLDEAWRRLSAHYPTYAEWQSLASDTPAESKPLKLLAPDVAESADAILNSDITSVDLRNPKTARWVVKRTVAYLWARTVPCKSCRATIPLLKTRWLCLKEEKRVLLEMKPNAAGSGVEFGVRRDVPVSGNSAAARKASDRALAGGTMSRTGVKCPCCSAVMTMEDLRYEGQSGHLGTVMTAVVVDGPNGKEYRLPTQHELDVSTVSLSELEAAYTDVPYGVPMEPTPKGGGGAARAFSVGGYGLLRWADLFTSRQLLALGELVKAVRRVPGLLAKSGYSPDWQEAIWGLLALANDRAADYGSAVCSWHNKAEKLRNTFGRFALPIVWDFTETNPYSGSTGDYRGAVEWVAKVADRNGHGIPGALPPKVEHGSAMQIDGQYDAIVTDPPYYDAIPYSDLMDFFYIWLRRSLSGLSKEVDEAFSSPLGPKWDHEAGDGELIDDSSRFGGDRTASKKNFEDGMASVFRRCHMALTTNGILVIVFANKNPDAWETLVGALIRAGFVVDGSLPIQTEMGSRARALSSAALSSSVWLVCRKRPSTSRPGFSGPVLSQMREKIRTQMHRFWDAGIHGPDFVWAATGPALEAYSRHPVVYRETSMSGQREQMPVEEFLREVRRLVVEFAVGRVLKPSAHDEEDQRIGLDDITTYYVLHRDSFGMTDAPIGACILYAMSCGLSDADLADRYEILARAGGRATENDDEIEGAEVDESEDEEEAETQGTGSKVRLRRWDQRKRKTLGVEGVGGRPVPMIDRVHRLMQLWKAGDLAKVNAFLDQTGLARDALFAQLVQALIELSRRDGKSDEASLLESISNHLRARSGVSAPAQTLLI